MRTRQDQKDKLRIEETQFIHRELINLSDESITMLCRRIKELKNQDAYKRKLMEIPITKNIPVQQIVKNAVESSGQKKKRPRIVVTKEKEVARPIEKSWLGLQEFAKQYLQ